MSYLEPNKPVWKPPVKYQPKDNFEELQNDGHNLVTEDFEDSPFSDRK